MENIKSYKGFYTISGRERKELSLLSDYRENIITEGVHTAIESVELYFIFCDATREQAGLLYSAGEVNYRITEVLKNGKTKTHNFFAEIEAISTEITLEKPVKIKCVLKITK